MSLQQETENSPGTTVVIAATGDKGRALRIAGLVLLVTLLGVLALLALTEESKRDMAWVVAGVLLSVAGLVALLLFFQYRPAAIWISAERLNLQGIWRTRSFPAPDLRAVEGAYRLPGMAMAAAMVLVAKTRAVPQPILTLHLDIGPEDVNTGNYRQSPDLIARRLGRYLRKGAAALAPSETEVARQAKRHASPTLFTGSIGSALRGARFVESGPRGLRVGNSTGKMVLYPWSDVVAAHLTLDLNRDEIGEVELASGRVILLRGSYDVPLEELVLEVAPRAYGQRGERLRRLKNS